MVSCSGHHCFGHSSRERNFLNHESKRYGELSARMNGGPGGGLGLGSLGGAEDSSPESHGLFSEQTCCLVDDSERCTRPAGNASYSKRIQKTVAQRKLKLHLHHGVRHIYICDYHKGVIQCARTKRTRRDSEEDSNEADTDAPDVDLFQLQVNTLRRYKRLFKVPTRPGLNKAQLADTLTKHFKTLAVSEKEALTYFIYMVKTNRNKLDNRNGNGNETS